MADLSDLNPAFSSRLAQLRAALDAAGIKESVLSGYRSPEYQNQMYQNHLAKVAGQPLPYPGVEAPSVVAAPWRSFHNYGLAADFNLANPNDYARLATMAPQFGLTGIGPSDKGHIQLGGDLASDIAQYHLANWRPESQPAPASGAIAYTEPTAAPSRVGTTARGTSPYLSPLDIVLNAERGDRNINNIHATTSSGQAQGNAQITTGTWADFAPKAGVDLKQYPTPDSAPRDVQIKVASVIPLNRWASSTVNAVLAKYPGIDTSQPLGVIQSNAISPSGGSTTPGTTINSTPTVAGVSQAQWGQLGQNLKNTGKALGLPDDDSQGQQQIKPSPMIGPQPQARNVSPLLGNPQLYAQRMAAINQPMTWGQGPPGQMAGTGYGAQAQPSVYGMSLMSNLQRLSDPMWMNQMAGGSYG